MHECVVFRFKGLTSGSRLDQMAALVNERTQNNKHMQVQYVMTKHCLYLLYGLYFLV